MNGTLTLLVWVAVLGGSAWVIAHPWWVRKRDGWQKGRVLEDKFSYTGTLHSYTVKDPEASLLLYLEGVSIAAEYGRGGCVVGDLSLTQCDRIVLEAPYDGELVEFCNQWVVEEADIRIERVERGRQVVALSVSDGSGRGITKARPYWVAERRI